MPKISWRELLQVALKPQYLWKFLSLKSFPLHGMHLPSFTGTFSIHHPSSHLGPHSECNNYYVIVSRWQYSSAMIHSKIARHNNSYRSNDSWTLEIHDMHTNLSNSIIIVMTFLLNYLCKCLLRTTRMVRAYLHKDWLLN